MVQSVNTNAVLALTLIVRRPNLLVPHVSVTNISQVDFKVMKQNCQIQAVIFDKDNTLTAPYDLSLHKDAALGLANAISVFGTTNVAILSNSAGTTSDDPNYENAIQIEKSLGISVIRHDEKKPGGIVEVLTHFNLKDPNKICMVGDRILTDVVFGNLYGMLTIHTQPLFCKGIANSRDNIMASVIRSLENTILYSDWWGSQMLWNHRPTHKYWSPTQGHSLIIINHRK